MAAYITDRFARQDWQVTRPTPENIFEGIGGVRVLRRGAGSSLALAKVDVTDLHPLRDLYNAAIRHSGPRLTCLRIERLAERQVLTGRGLSVCELEPTATDPRYRSCSPAFARRRFQAL